MNLTSLFKFEFCKTREVKTPSKAFDANGIDFFVPTNLRMCDFEKNFSIYLNEWLIDFESENGIRYVVVPIEFAMKSLITGEVFSVTARYSENGTTLYRGTKADGSSFNPIACISDPNCVITKFLVKPGAKILIPSGIKANLPKYIALDAANKSGIASKRGLIVGAELIDQNYQGEIHINLINTDYAHSVIINAGDKIVQFLPLFIPTFNEIVESPDENTLFEGTDSTRGEGGFGSSGVK